MWPVFAQLCSMVAKRGDHWGTWAAAALLQSPCHDLLDLWHQRQRRNTLNFTNTETWHQAHHISPLLSATQMVWPCTMCHLLYQIYHKLHITGTEKKEGPGRHVLNVGRLMSISVAVLTLTHFTEMHGEPVFDIAWYCKPHRMGHGQHINLKWIWLDENGMSPQGIIQSCPSQNLTAMLFQ